MIYHNKSAAPTLDAVALESQTGWPTEEMGEEAAGSDVTLRWEQET